MTPSALLATALEDLGISDIPTFQATDGDSIFTPETLGKYSTITDENQFVHELTPILNEIFSENGHIVVNSEYLPWIDNLKPDLFLCPPWAYTKKSPSPVHLNFPNNLNPKYQDYAYLYGIIQNKRLFDSVYLLDCKMENTNGAIGELIQHLQTLNFKSLEHPQTSRGMLFCPRGCYLVMCEHLSITSIQLVDWTTPGSRQHVLNFFPPFFWNIHPFLKSFGVAISNPESVDDSAFLGAGATGRVIRVCS
jgi:hypothetical protein